MKKTSIAFLIGILCVVAIAATRAPFYASGPKLVQSGFAISVTDGKVTNTFTTAYSSAPNVVLTPLVAATRPTNGSAVVSISTTGFVILSDPSITNEWVAIGTP